MNLLPQTADQKIILTLTCADTTGIVAAVSGFLAARRYLISEAQHHCDPYTSKSFMRTVFCATEGNVPALSELEASFDSAVAQRFGMSYRFYSGSRKCPVLLAVSRQGHCLTSILQRWSAGTLPIDVVGVVSNHEDLRGLAEWHRVRYHYLPVISGRKAEQEERIKEVFELSGAELLVLARYMQILTPEACSYFEGRAINIHHSFLPGFKGARAYYQAFERGVKLIGATAHYVTTDLDEGPIIEQDVGRVEHTLSPEDFTVTGSEIESVVLNRAVKWHAEHRVFRNGRTAVVLR